MHFKTRRNVVALLGGGVTLGLTASAVAYAQPEKTPLVMVNNQTNSDHMVTPVIQTVAEEETIVNDTQTISV